MDSPTDNITQRIVTREIAMGSINASINKSKMCLRAATQELVANLRVKRDNIDELIKLYEELQSSCESIVVDATSKEIQ